MTARAKTAILPWLMAATILLALVAACATTRMAYDREAYLECLRERPLPHTLDDRLICMDKAEEHGPISERPFEVRCGVENARPILLASHKVIVTTDEGWTILPLHDCPPLSRMRYCYTFPVCKRA